MSHDGIDWNYILYLRFEMVYILVRRTFIVKGMQIRCLEPGRIVSWIPLDRVWPDHPHFLKIASIWDSLQAFLKLVLLDMIIFWILWFFRKKLRIFISKVIFIAIRVFVGRVFNLLLFTLAFAGRSFSLQIFRLLFWLFKKKRAIIFLRSLINSC